MAGGFFAAGFLAAGFLAAAFLAAGFLVVEAFRPPFLLAALAASSSIACSRVMSSAPFPSGSEALTLPCFT